MMVLRVLTGKARRSVERFPLATTAIEIDDPPMDQNVARRALAPHDLSNASAHVSNLDRRSAVFPNKPTQGHLRTSEWLGRAASASGSLAPEGHQLVDDRELAAHLAQLNLGAFCLRLGLDLLDQSAEVVAHRSWEARA